MEPEPGPSELLALVYEGLPRGLRWQRMLTGLRRLLAADGAEVRMQVPTLAIDPRVISADRDADEMRAWCRRTPIAATVVSADVRVSVLEDHAGPRPEGACTRHGLILSASGLAHDAPAIELMVWRDPARRSATRLGVPGPFRRDATELLLWLAPHLQRAAALAFEMTKVEIERATLATALDRLTLGVIAVDGDLTVQMTNPVARAWLDKGDGLRVIEGRIAAAHYDDQQRLAGIVRSALDRDGGAVGAIPLRRAGDRRPLTLIVEAVPSTAGAPNEVSRALILFGDPDERAEVDLEQLGNLFGLTRAEGRVAARLAAGKRLSEVASDLGISHQTARSYLKAVFRKTNTCRQSELVGLLLGQPSSSLPF